MKTQMEACVLCPRKCKANRSQGEKGICGQSANIRVARADLHMWEEPSISGSKGSGTVFFSGCSLHCVFCQNHNIANGEAGKEITIERLAEIFLELQEKGANNINLVTAGQFVPQVVEALKIAKANGLQLPVVYNTSSYENVETLKLLDGYVVIYLPDLKYVDKELSKQYSHAEDYFQQAKEAIKEMVRQTGEMEFVVERSIEEKYSAEGPGKVDKIEIERSPEQKYEIRRFGIQEYQLRSEQGEDLVMTKGVIVRHLILPGCVEDSRKVLEYLLGEYGNQIFISIMNQYTPLPHVAAYPELNRKVTREEYEEVVNYAIELGIENGFVQEGEAAAESFIPEFDGRGV